MILIYAQCLTLFIVLSVMMKLNLRQQLRLRVIYYTPRLLLLHTVCVCTCVRAWAYVCVGVLPLSVCTQNLHFIFYLLLFSKWTVTELTAYSIIYCEIILVTLNHNMIIYIGIILSLTFHYKTISIQIHTHNRMYWCWCKRFFIQIFSLITKPVHGI